ncbi:hypothetical protein E2P81_ATG03714 [Venturia nashicola]|nr:hypothetical protein E2P81_ATG03714 [Venturia nashicola]
MGRPRQVLHAASYIVTRHNPNWDLLHSDILRPNGMIFHMGELLLKKVGTIRFLLDGNEQTELDITDCLTEPLPDPPSMENKNDPDSIGTAWRVSSRGRKRDCHFLHKEPNRVATPYKTALFQIHCYTNLIGALHMLVGQILDLANEVQSPILQECVHSALTSN